jgi:hypothetical protein
MDDKSLAARVAELEEVVAYLKSELGLSIHESHVSALTGHGLERGQARAVMALHDAKGRTLSVFQIGDAASLQPQCVKQSVCRARRLIPGIKTEYGRGYFLTIEGQTYVQRLLRGDPASSGGPATASGE